MDITVADQADFFQESSLELPNGSTWCVLDFNGNVILSGEGNHFMLRIWQLTTVDFFNIFWEGETPQFPNIAASRAADFGGTNLS